MENCQIAGKWETKSAGVHNTFEFNNDSTYCYRNHVTGKVTNSHYQISGDVINYIEFGSSARFLLHDEKLFLTSLSTPDIPTSVYTRI
jgi:hypothetical protein